MSEIVEIGKDTVDITVVDNNITLDVTTSVVSLTTAAVGVQGIQGVTGPTGPSNVLSVGSVTSGGAAAASITGTTPAQVLNLVLPKGDTGAQGPKGDTGATGPKGDTGDQGIQGVKGDTGDTGPQGASGDSSTHYHYTTRTNTTSGDPTANQLGWNNSTQISSTALRVNHLDADGQDNSIFLDLINQNDVLIIQDKNNAANYQKWEVSGTPTYNATWDLFPVTYLGSGGTGTTNFANSHSVLFIVISVGNVGPQGPTGPGVAAGGTAGQALVKIDGTNYNTQWTTIVSGVSSVDALTGAVDLTNKYLTQTNAASTYAPISSPSLTGTPLTTTAAVDTNTTQIASTAFVLGQAGSATPNMDGTAAVGTSTRYARADHIHGSDTSKALSPLYYAPATLQTTENRATTDFSPLSATATFGVSLAASTTYEIDIELFFDPVDVAVNARTLSFGFRLGSGTLTSIGFDVTHNRRSTTLTDTVYHQTINAIGISPIELSRTSNVVYESIIRAKGIVTVNTASKLIPTLQWNSLGDTLNIRRGSYVKFTPLPNTTSNGTWA